MVMTAKKLEKDLRVRLEGDLKPRFDAVLESKEITQQRAVNRLVGWFMEQDSLVQSMILGQIAPDDDLVSIILERMRPKRTRPLVEETGQIEVIHDDADSMPTGRR